VARASSSGTIHPPTAGPSSRNHRPTAARRGRSARAACRPVHVGNNNSGTPVMMTNVARAPWGHRLGSGGIPRRSTDARALQLRRGSSLMHGQALAAGRSGAWWMTMSNGAPVAMAGAPPQPRPTAPEGSCSSITQRRGPSTLLDLGPGTPGDGVAAASASSRATRSVARSKSPCVSSSASMRSGDVGARGRSIRARCPRARAPTEPGSTGAAAGDDPVAIHAIGRGGGGNSILETAAFASTGRAATRLAERRGDRRPQ